MTEIQTIEGDFDCGNARFGIAATRFNGFVVESLVSGAVDALRRHGVESQRIRLVRVPGAYELPLVVRRMARSGSYDALIVLGCVIRGSTPHFDYVAGNAASGLSTVMLEEEVPIAFGLLTTDTIEQALERAGTKAGNKGNDAALTAIEMVSLMDRLQG